MIDFIDVFIATGSLVAAATNLTGFDEQPTWPATTATSCSYTDSSIDSADTDGGGLGRHDVTLDYDNNFYSYAGCRCISGYDNVYIFDTRGTSEQIIVQHRMLASAKPQHCRRQSSQRHAVLVSAPTAAWVRLLICSLHVACCIVFLQQSIT